MENDNDPPALEKKPEKDDKGYFVEALLEMGAQIVYELPLDQTPPRLTPSPEKKIEIKQ